MAQQTAVEWFYQRILSKHIKEVFKQAKAMEKEQIVKAVYDGMGTNFDPNFGRAEQYYKETFNK